MVVQLFSSSSERGPEEEAVCFTGLHASLTSLKEQEFPSQGSPIGQYSPQEISDHNQCITDRLGSRLGGQVSERQVGTPLVIRAHKYARTEGCSSCSGSPITIICYKHVLIGTDSTSVVYNINHQGGTRSLKCLQVATDLLTWACPQLSSLRAIHIPDTANRAADILSRTGPLPGEWRLHTEVIAQIWARYGTAQVDLFASVETTHCPRWYSLKVQDGSLGLDALSQEWPTDLLYTFPPFPLIPQVLRRIGEGCYMLQDFIHVGQEDHGFQRWFSWFRVTRGSYHHRRISCHKWVAKFGIRTQWLCACGYDPCRARPSAARWCCEGDSKQC